MAKPNYQFEKRQRDLAKKKKQEEKRLQKLAVKTAAADPGSVTAENPSGVMVADDGRATAAPPDSE